MKHLKSTAVKTSLLALSALLTLGSFSGALANDTKQDKWSAKSLWQKPVVRDAAVGTAIGVGAGLFTHKTSVGKGALAGGLTGAGVGALGQAKYLKDKPLLRNTLQGAAVGTGTSYATDSSRLKGAAVGAGAGAGYSLLRKYMDEKH